MRSILPSTTCLPATTLQVYFIICEAVFICDQDRCAIKERSLSFNLGVSTKGDGISEARDAQKETSIFVLPSGRKLQNHIRLCALLSRELGAANDLVSKRTLHVK